MQRAANFAERASAWVGVLLHFVLPRASATNMTSAAMRARPAMRARVVNDPLLSAGAGLLVDGTAIGSALFACCGASVAVGSATGVGTGGGTTAFS